MKKLSAILLASALMTPLFATGCYEHQRVYTYGPGETSYYLSWEHETHRDHMDYERRQQREQHEYWKWRHHHDHDHDH